MNAGLILAGGSGERLKALGKPKQFCEVNWTPLMMFCLQAFERCAAVDTINIVAAEEHHGMIQGWLERFHITKFCGFALPGRTRQHSVFNGLQGMKAGMAERSRVIVHDAARPLVTEKIIEDCVRFAADCDGATPVIPINDTVYRSEDKMRITALLNRDELFAGQTPECYDFRKYLAVFESMEDGAIAAVRGGSEIAFRGGMSIRLFDGDMMNFKVSTERDWEYFRFLMQR
jgi:2-C-methyl-D-erythritol 4-phosphate cytidylyltransferase